MTSPTNEQPAPFDLNSDDVAARKRADLKRLFPEVFDEDKIDFDQLRRVMGDWVDEGTERFGLTWPGKAACMKVIQAPATGALRPDRDESVNFDESENVFIKGDNLEVLKLLQKAYFGKVKMIYIDPPYNTGGEFIYPDRFAENLDTYLDYTGQSDSDGRRFSTNTESAGRFHSRWLNMIYPRIFLARNLLKEDGVMFISIDDGEVGNLRSVCDQIFGEENFVANIIWQKKFSRANDATYFSTMHDHILCYAKQAKNADAKMAFELQLLPRGEDIPAGYANPDDDPRGLWTSVVLSAKSGTEKLKYTITTPSGRVCLPPDGRFWGVSEQRLNELVADGRIWFGQKGDGTPRMKTFLSEVQDGLRPNTIWMHGEVGHNQEGRQELKKLFDDKALFDGPKPVRLMEQIIQIACPQDEESIVLDFFAGSSTMGHAIFKTNANREVKNRFVLVQLPEALEEDSDPFRAGYRSIADIGQDRLRRAAASLQPHSNGFRSFSLSRSAFSKWDVDSTRSASDLLSILEDHAVNIADSKDADILFELLLKDGFELSTEIAEISLVGSKVYSVADGALLICLERHLTKEIIDALADLAGENDAARIVCLDAGFRGNDQLKANAVQTFKSRLGHGEDGSMFRTV